MSVFLFIDCFIFIFFKRGSPCGVMANALDCAIQLPLGKI